jgi:outer membrane protein assembly factor BamE (lipoprotein component of BamABCDE complex)
MTIRIRRWALVSSSILVFSLAFVAVWYERTFYERAYRQLARGTTKADVLKRFGKPQRVGDCQFRTPSWDNVPEDQTAKTCVEIFEYSSRTSIGEWVIGFDKEGKVVSKAYSSSP